MKLFSNISLALVAAVLSSTALTSHAQSVVNGEINSNTKIETAIAAAFKDSHAQNGGVGINKEKLMVFDTLVDTSYLLGGKYILAQKGKKDYFLLIAK